MREFVLLVFCLFSSNLLAAEDWELQKDQDGIKVFTRLSADLEFREYKAEGIIRAPFDSLYSFLTDFDAYHTWIYACLKSELLVSEKNHYIYYAQYDMPWPLSDRDALSEIEITFTDDMVLINSRPANYKFDEKKSFLRIKYFKEQYQLVPMGDSVLMRMQGVYDPGGWLPAWLVNKYLVYGPYDTLISIRKEVE